VPGRIIQWRPAHYHSGALRADTFAPPAARFSTLGLGCRIFPFEAGNIIVQVFFVPGRKLTLRMHATRDTNDLIISGGSGGRVTRGVGRLPLMCAVMESGI
jgi:hypothetical protein